MKKFTIKVPYSEVTVRDCDLCRNCSTRRKRQRLCIERDKGEYSYDTYTGYLGYAENYEEHWDDAEWAEQE
jgi:hypothetical protein